MNSKKIIALNFKTRHLINVIVIVLIFSNPNNVFGQKGHTISDFYEYANKEWLDITVIPENASVVNNWGILWDEIIDKSIEILSGKIKYDLDKDHDYLLTQMQNFYASTAEYSKDERKRVELVQKNYPMLFGVLFSKITLPPEEEEKIKELIAYLIKAYRTKIAGSKKIKDNNAEIFLTKLDEMEFEIGAPQLSMFQTIPELSTNSLELNIQLSESYQLENTTNKANWQFPPFETECRYGIYDNSVRIYAGTLYAIDFIEEDDFVTLFATIGRTIAHEMTHAFDRMGKKFNKKDWNDINQALINQFDQYEIQDGYKVDGKKTLQENFADLGGVEVSLMALKLYIKDHYAQYSNEDKSKAIRHFFIAYAQFWREKATSAFEIASLQRIHTPQKFRAIGPIYNQDEFYEVYEIDLESKYYIPKNSRISIW
jgi:endothelin-converting enzyme/putative endopeptidase